MNLINSAKFQIVWSHYYGDCVPLTNIFKYNLRNKWLRFHSLPNGKRHAQNNDELSEIIKKKHCLMKDVIGDSSKAFVVFATPNYETSPSEFNLDCELNQTHKAYIEVCNKIIEKFNLENEFTINFDEMSFSINSALVELDKFSFDDVFSQIANDELDYLFIMNPKNGDIFAPYDGGVDLIIGDETKKANLREKHKNWLSNREDGF